MRCLRAKGMRQGYSGEGLRYVMSPFVNEEQRFWLCTTGVPMLSTSIAPENAAVVLLFASHDPVTNEASGTRHTGKTMQLRKLGYTIIR